MKSPFRNGIMISKTIGCRGTLFSDEPKSPGPGQERQVKDESRPRAHRSMEVFELYCERRGFGLGSGLGDEFIGNGHEKWEVSMGNSHCKWEISMDEGFLMSFLCEKLGPCFTLY